MTSLSNDEVHLSDLMHRLAQHISEMSNSVFEVEEMLGLDVTHSNRGFNLKIERVQSLDFLRQSLEDCSILTLSVSRLCREEATFSVPKRSLLAKVKLEATKALVAGEEIADAGATKRTGEVDFF